MTRELPSPKEPMRVAEELVSALYTEADHPTLRAWRGGYWAWHRDRWAESEEATIRKATYNFTEDAVYLDQKGNEQPWAPTRHKVADLLDALRARTHLVETVRPPTWLARPDGAPPAHRLVSCSNGLLDITTRDLFEHDPRFWNEVAVPFAYDPEAPAPERWLGFLDQLWPSDPDSIAALQQFLGYVISGRIDLHKIMLLIGPTRAGKGVIARVLKHLVGDGNHAGPTLASLGTNFGLSPLIGKPLGIISDARLSGANTSAVVERLLSISGQDMLTIDRKYREPWTGTLPTRFVVISNELPRFGDASGAIANRFVVLTLQKSWLGNENPNLTNELIEELPGILNWALDGLEALQADGRFTAPQSSTDAITLLQDLVSPISAFVRDRCSTAPDDECPADDLYNAWRTWAEENGHRVTSAQSFGRDLRAVVPGLATVRPREGGEQKRRWYRGIKLAPQAHNDPNRVSARLNDDEGVRRAESRHNPLWPNNGQTPGGDGAPTVCADCGEFADQLYDNDRCAPCLGRQARAQKQ